MDYFLFRRISSGQPIQELALTVGANAIVGSDATGLLKTFTIGGANGILQLDVDGKVPVSAIPDKAIKTVQTVANQAARFAFTVAQAQVGDLVKQTDDGSYYELVDEMNIGNANGWLKRNLADEIEELNFSLANGATQAVTIVKKLTVINVEPPVNPAHTCTLLITGGSGGEIVMIQRPAIRSAVAVGTVAVRTTLGATTSQIVVANLGSTTIGHQTLMLQRSFGTIPPSVQLFRPILKTSGNQILNVLAGGSTGQFWQPTVGSVVAHGGISPRAVIENQFGTAFNDGDSVTVQVYDFSSSPIASATFEFDKNSDYNPANVQVVIGEEADAFECMTALCSAMASYGFGGSFSQDTNVLGFPRITFAADAAAGSIYISSTNPDAGSPTENVYGEVPTGSGVILSIPGSRLLGFHVQHGASGGINQALNLQLNNGTEVRTVASIPAGGTPNAFLSLGQLAWEPGGLEFVIANENNPNAVFTVYQNDPASAGMTRIQAHYAVNTTVSCSVSGV